MLNTAFSPGKTYKGICANRVGGAGVADFNTLINIHTFLEMRHIRKKRQNHINIHFLVITFK